MQDAGTRFVFASKTHLLKDILQDLKLSSEVLRLLFRFSSFTQNNNGEHTESKTNIHCSNFFVQ